MPRFSVWVALLLAGCAQQPSVDPKPPVEKPVELPALPATFIDDPSCAGCLTATITLRPDGSFLLREQLGASEFYDFGKWRYADGKLELAGDRDPRAYSAASLRRADKVEALRGPFRMVGFYDGELFRECHTGIGWRLSATRAAQTLNEDYRKQALRPALVALDAQFEGAPEALRVLRPATLLKGRACP